MSPSFNQFGGLAGNSTNHYLIEAWNEILESLDQEGSAVNLVSIDFEKAFNSMRHSSCVQAFTKKGYCPHLVRMIAVFLSGRSTRYKIREQLSSERPVNGGSPQGTLLGNYLFIVTTDELENRKDDPSPTRTPPRENNATGLNASTPLAPQ